MQSATATQETARPNRKRSPAKPKPLFSDDELLDLAALEPAAPNVVAAIRYAREVVRGHIPACRWAILACKRFERDLTRIGGAWDFTFDIAKAEDACTKIQLFREVKGPRAGLFLVLAGWQKFCVVNIFGWVRKSDGTRRFSYALLYVPRGNGKTTLAAPLALYMLAIDGEGGAEVYSAAVTRQQARLVFDAARFMAQKETEFRSVYDVEVSAQVISQHSTASVFRPLSKDASSMDGLNVHFAVLDELAQHRTREVHDVLHTATGKRSQPLMLGITTTSANKVGIGYEQWKYAQRVLDVDAADHVDDDTYFAIIYTIDEGDDWQLESTWIKANPNWGVSVMAKTIRAIAQKAGNVPALQNAFKQKHLNMWTSGEAQWMTSELWESAADRTLKVEDFSDEELVTGLDLASKIDLAAKAKLFRRTIEGVTHYYLFTQFWLPQATIDNAQNFNTNYIEWAERGYITVTPGETNDFEAIQQSIVDDRALHNIVDVAYDPWQAAQMATNLEAASVPVIEYRPTVANFSPPMKELEALVRDGVLHHDGNPVMAYCVECVLVQEDFKGNIFPRKDKNDKTQKIDGLVAAVTALGRRMAIDANEPGPVSITLI